MTHTLPAACSKAPSTGLGVATTGAVVRSRAGTPGLGESCKTVGLEALREALRLLVLNP